MDDLIARLRALITEHRIKPKMVLFAVALVVVLVVAGNSMNGKSETKISRPQSSSASVVNPPTFFVHVVGQVKVPGVYALEVGSRLFDAVVAAGGFLKDADQSSVNLARQLSDGEQILVLKAGADEYAPSGRGLSSGRASQPVSLNRATQAELEALPGVGPTLAGRIVDWRQANGGFKNIEDLLKVGGIGQKLFAGLSKLVGL